MSSEISKVYFRYDDTNPEAEKKEYIDHIEEIVRWMGWKPFKVYYLDHTFYFYNSANQPDKNNFAISLNFADNLYQ